MLFYQLLLLSQIESFPIDIVVINLYPFKNEAVEKKLELSDAINYIDIGGPSMLRAAAKNYKNVIPLCCPSQYLSFMEEFEENIISIFIEPPGEDLAEQIESIEKRLKDRGQESDTLIKQRTKRLQLEIEYKDKFEFQFVNDNLKKTTDKIENTIRRKLK